ncbi:hypothetical protein K7X08_027977 [Anisodus acutangulus]|uniref:Phytosulfokine n=1 Tax=Anisodus acutangulus TaxID=402998 RepID=A0A9Q1MUY0_9SOLA|nr:hypothetical protein K7X08_027977 [Anisodus acutangulus]
MMKQKVYFLLLLLLVSVIMSSQASARFIANNQVEGEVKLHKVNAGDSIDKIGTTDLNRLMGLEEYPCEDEECIKRRILEEAHLDYIYTQHHNHP